MRILEFESGSIKVRKISRKRHRRFELGSPATVWSNKFEDLGSKGSVKAI